MNKKLKLLFAIISALLLICCVVSDVFHIYVVEVDAEKYSSLVLTILQIQATVSTVGIAVIAMITSKDNEYIYGIQTQSFLLRELNKPLSLEALTFISLICIPLAVGAYSIDLNNTVIGLFFLTICILISEFFLVVHISKDREKLKKIIFNEKYISDTNFNEKNNSYFLSSFYKTVCLNSQPSVYEVDDYVKCATVLLEKSVEKKEYFTSFTENYGQVVGALLSHSDSYVSNRGVKCLSDYNQLFYNRNLHISQGYNCRFFETAYDGISKAIQQGTLSVFGGIKVPLGVILRTQISEKNQIGDDVKNVVSLAGSCGFLLESNLREFNNYISRVYPYSYEWKDMVLDIDTEQVINLKEEYYIDANVYFAVSMIKNHKGKIYSEKILKDFLKLDNTKDFGHIKMMYIFCIVCYLLYLSVFESETVVEESVREDCKRILNNNWSSIKSFFYAPVTGSEIDFDFIKKILKKYEIFSAGAKTVLMDCTVEQSIVLLLLIVLQDCSIFYSAMQRIVGVQGFHFYTDFVQPEESIKKKIALLVEITGTQRADEDSLFLNLKNTITALYVKSELRNAESLRTQMGSNETLQNRFNSEMSDCIRSRLDILSNKDLTGSVSSYSCNFTYLDFNTSLYFFKDNNYLNVAEHSFSCAFFVELGNTLKNQLAKRDVQSEEQLKQLIEDVRKEDCIVIGTPPTLFGIPYTTQEEFQKVLEQKKRILSYENGNEIIVLDPTKVDIQLDGLESSIEQYHWHQIVQEIHETDRGQFLVNVTNDIWLPFSEQELKDYYKNMKFILRSKVKMTVRVSGADIGMVVRFQ